MERCSEHGLLEARMKQQDKEYTNLLNFMKSLQINLTHKMDRLDEQIVKIEKLLVGNLETGMPGWITQVVDLQKDSKTLKDNDREFKTAMTKLLPWFSAFKWTFLVIAPMVITGTATFIIGLITGKIKILM
jgi:hypothetical protein